MMSGLEVTRDVSAIAVALGLVGLLAPPPRVPRTIVRGAALVVAIAAWAVLTVTLLPSGDTIRDHLMSPVGAGAALVGAVAVVGGLWLAGRAVLRKPVWWFVLLGVTMPLRIPVPLGGEDRNLLLPLYLVIAAGVAAVALGWWTGDERVRRSGTVFDLPLAAFLGFAVLSAVWSVDGEEAAVKLVFFYVPFALLYVAVLALWTPRAVPALATTTVALSLPVAGIAMWQYQARDLFLNDRLEKANINGQFFRANSVFYDPNILGRFLVVAIVVLVAWAWLRPTRRTIVAAVALNLPLLGGLAVTFSRSSCLMLMTALGIMAWRGFGGRRTLAVGGATLLILGIGAVFVSGNVRRAATDVDRLNRVSEGRFDLIRGGVHIWEQAPVHGAGLGGFEKRYQETLTPAEQRRVRVVISHNTPVTILSELGAVGFGLFVWLAISLWRAVSAAARRLATDTSYVAWTMLALATGILMHALFYAGFFEDPYVWVVAAGALLVAGARRAEPAADV
ncbi:MAG: O-antigen ligase family protein [Actinobacteria bacterium]|nr:O-antigen ligase family protein [Actinomycetota bacterium]